MNTTEILQKALADDYRRQLLHVPPLARVSLLRRAVNAALDASPVTPKKARPRKKVAA